MQSRDVLIEVIFVLAGLSLFCLVVWYVTSLILQARHLQLLRRIAFSGHPIITSVSTERALAVARERRSKIARLLEGREFQGVVNRRFQESPLTNVDEVNEGFGDDRVAAAIHTAHLRWQLQEDRFLLIERVMDAITAFQRSHPESPDRQLTAVLVHQDKGRRADTYPWRVVLHTEGTGALVFYLSEQRDWLGIGIDVAPPLPTVPLGCYLGTGSEGQVGGLLRSTAGTQRDYGLTCHHVLSPSCKALYWPHPPNRPAYGDYANGALDAALIELGSPCFIPSPTSGRSIACASSADRESFITGKLPVIKSPVLNQRRGLIQHVVAAVPGEDGRQIRAPHLLIVPTFSKRFGLIWPLFDRAFSVKGNSGAWVIDMPANLWFGMVVLGSKPPLTITYALEASFVLDALSSALPGEAPFAPYRTS